MIGCFPFIADVFDLIVDLIVDFLGVSLKELDYVLEGEPAPFFTLDLIHIFKDSIHGVPVESIVKLIEIDIVKNSEVVEERRDYFSGSGD